jgi:hypothetical protein
VNVIVMVLNTVEIWAFVNVVTKRRVPKGSIDIEHLDSLWPINCLVCSIVK